MISSWSMYDVVPGVTGKGYNLPKNSDNSGSEVIDDLEMC